MNQEQKLEQFAERELQRNIHKIIIDDSLGGYVAFGKYHIKPGTTGFVVSTWDREIHRFANKRTAISWCIADKINHINLANQILNLDQKQQTLEADINCRRTLGTRGRTEDFAEIVNTKIQPKLDRHKMVSAELEKCINSAKYIQIRGFNNETARTSGPQAN
jgi:hypothetical protein